MSLETRIVAAIGALNGGKVYAVKAPDATAWPVVVWQRITTQETNTHEDSVTLKAALVQVSVYAETFTAALNLRASVATALETAGAILEDERDSYEDDAAVYRADADFTIWDGN